MVVSCTIDIPQETKLLIEHETSSLFELHPEYVWLEPNHYCIPLYTWQDVSVDLIEKLQQKITDVLFEQSAFTLYGLQYKVKISDHIDIVLEFQTDRHYRTLAQAISEFFGEQKTSNAPPMLLLARYKVPSKQQYTHLKNKLSKLVTNTEIAVHHVSLQKVTDFGHGVKTFEHVGSVSLHQTP
ncbi:MAG TPA: hypothetical protein PKJ68_04730 [Candidatus Woesebacteria bacterium]|nr:hypothetical protein [Candidatus Woesebacteria bacterium]